jgi:hypothetical protein
MIGQLNEFRIFLKIRKMAQKLIRLSKGRRGREEKGEERG